MEKPYTCLRCIHLQQQEEEGHYEKVYGVIDLWKPPTVYWWCEARICYIRTVPNQCKDFFPLTQHKLEIGGENTVKTEDIPSEGARLDITNLPEEVDLKAVEEKMAKDQAGKAGGLIIKYTTKKGETFEQKYHKVAGAALAVALKNLGVKDTEELQKEWYHYKLTDMRIGFPRMIPVSKAK